MINGIRGNITNTLNFDDFQSILAEYWQLHIESVEELLIDATRYESDIRYSTGAKLLWERCEWFKVISDYIYDEYRIHRPGNKY
jgi:hypothetical protein